jgi:(p)ppGpp synthase/HD superfamily hydrolase
VLVGLFVPEHVVPEHEGSSRMTEAVAAEPILGPRFNEAFAYASSLHRGQLRKGKHVPYLAHLMGVASLVLEDGGDEDEAIAALLHDAVEDQGGIPVLNEIRRRFGTRVAEIVERCTDHDPAKDRPEWRVRKRHYVAALAHVDESCRRVALADKLYNARELLADYRQAGDQVWCRFSAGREILGYLRALAVTFSRHSKSPMAEELDRTVAELERMAATAAA